MQGNRTCDICKTLIKNLPDPPPRAPETASPNGQMFEDGEMLRNNAQFIVDQAPTGTDVVFDCIRVSSRFPAPSFSASMNQRNVLLAPLALF